MKLSKLLKALCLGVGTYLALEAFLWGVQMAGERRWFLPSNQVDLLIRARYRPDDCAYIDHLMSHPYLGYVYRQDVPEKCSPHANNHAVSGPSHPAEKDPGEYTVFLIGGSVAEMLLLEREENGHFTTDELNRRYLPPKPYSRFRVIGAAMGDWRQPQQLVALLLHQPEIDAVVDLEGYNEHFSHRGMGLPVGISPNASQLLAAGGLMGQTTRGARMLALAEEWPILRHLPSFHGLLKRELRLATQDAWETFHHWERRWSLNDPPSRLSPAEQKMRFHRSMLAAMGGLCTAYGWKCAAFIQPFPLWKKKLTVSEEDFQRSFYAEPGSREQSLQVYREMVEGLLAPPALGLPVVDLTGVFSGEEGEIYRDHVHYLRDEGPKASRGNRLVWGRIMAKVAKSWGFRPR